MRLEEHTVERKRNHFQREVGEPNIKAAGKSCGYGLFPELHISFMNKVATHGFCPLSAADGSGLNSPIVSRFGVVLRTETTWPKKSDRRSKHELYEHMHSRHEQRCWKPKALWREHPFVVNGYYGRKEKPIPMLSPMRCHNV